MKRILLLLPLFLLLIFKASARDTELYRFLMSIPGIEVKAVDSSAWNEYYEIMLPQPLDHFNPGSTTFKQKIFLGHRSFERPVVMETEGYGAPWMNGFLVNELSGLLMANQVYVEHRFFGASVPEKLEWQYLTCEQDAADYHAIRQLFGKVYKGKWLATGVSKGGQTATAYKLYYPDDVDVTVPYVAPINYKRLDKRIDRHFELVGTEACREHLFRIQEQLLKNKQTMLSLYESICKQQGFSFKIMDAESAYDYSVLELPFSFWQYTADCNILPDESSLDAEKMVRFLVQIVSPYWYTESTDAFAPANYQFYHQLGYYEYDERPFRKYLKHKDYPNSAFVPASADVKWDPSYARKLKKFISSGPERMIFIYGEADPWGATAPSLPAGSGSLKMVKKGGTHGTTILTLDPEQQKQVIEALSKWLGMEVKVPVYKD